MHVNKKGFELVWWTLMIIVIAIVVLLIFFYFMRSGMLHIEGLSHYLFGAPAQFANKTP